MATYRISNLPDDLLGKILSLVPTKLAASTSVLSKRWRNLLPLVDSLDFDESMLLYPDRRDGQEEATVHESCIRRQHLFSEFVDKTLALLSTCPLIKKLSLKCYYEDDKSRVNRWIRTALERGCLELDLESGCDICIDSEFFTSKTLVKLTISDGFYPACCSLPCGGVFFPALKTLNLVSVSFQSCEMIELFIHGCPALEELFIYDWMLFLSSPYVKRLTLASSFEFICYQHCIRLKTPSLLYLDYSSYVAERYRVSLDSLVEARLDLRLYEPANDIENYGDITSLIEGMSSIKSLHLSPSSLEVFYFCCHYMPVLNNLLSLSIESNKEKGWQGIPNLLNNSPNLQTLAIKGLVHRVTDCCGDACPCICTEDMEMECCTEDMEMECCLSRCRVKVLEISEYGGSLGELKQMGHFLGKLECLETVKVSVEDDTNNTNYLRDNLMALPRVSSKCNIHFI